MWHCLGSGFFLILNFTSSSLCPTQKLEDAQGPSPTSKKNSAMGSSFVKMIIVFLISAMCVHVYVCVCERERERERDRQTDRQIEKQLFNH
jgi:large-conductance mechanosensitive channel